MEIQSLETFTKEHHPDRTAPVSFVRVRTDTSEEGIGQISPYNADISTKVFHRQVAPHALGRDALAIEDIVDDIIDAEYKFPWSYLNRALAGLDTALWDLKAKHEGASVCELLGGQPTTLKPYGSSMSREITPEDEAERLVELRNEHGFEAFKIRVGSKMGHNEDAWSGRTENLITTVREAIGYDTELFVDANSCYTPDKAIEVGELLDEYGVVHYEEPCPFPEIEWTAEVREAFEGTDLQIAGGEQDNDLARWRRMIDMHTVDIVQPDICYIGGLTRALRVAELAADAGLPVVPHSANHSMVTVFTMHMLAAVDNAGEYFEYSIEDHWAEGLLEPELVVEDGEIAVPDGPGWGVSIDPAWLATSSYEASTAD